jgi:hypothetical protein
MQRPELCLPLPVMGTRFPQFSLRRLLWTVTFVGLFAACVAASGTRASSEAVAVAFGVSLIAQAAFLVLESQYAALRWFGLGFTAGVIATLFAAFQRGAFAFVTLLLSPKSHNLLRPFIESTLGALTIAVGLSLASGIIVGALTLVVGPRRGIGITSLLFLGLWLLLGFRAIAVRDTWPVLVR